MAQPTRWQGTATKTNFFDAGNWSAGIPTSSTSAIFDLAGGLEIHLANGTAFSDQVNVDETFRFTGFSSGSYSMGDLVVGSNTTVDTVTFNADSVVSYREIHLTQKATLNTQDSIKLFSSGGMLLDDSTVKADHIGTNGLAGVTVRSGARLEANRFEIGRPQFGPSDAISSASVSGINSEVDIAGDLLVGGGAEVTDINVAYLTVEDMARVKTQNLQIAARGTNASNEAVVIFNKGSRLECSGSLEVGSEFAPALRSEFVLDGSTAITKNLTLLSGRVDMINSAMDAESIHVTEGAMNLFNGGLSFTQGFLVDGGTTTVSAGQILGPRVEIRGGTLQTDESSSVSTGLLIVSGGHYEVNDLSFAHLNLVRGISGTVAGTITHTAGNIFDVYTNSNFRMSTDVDTSGVKIKNYGTIEAEGDGFGSTARIMGALENQSNGEVRVSAGRRLRFASPRAQHLNGGRIDTVGSSTEMAELEFEGAFTNELGGLITARNSIIRFDRGITNSGRISSALGDVQIYGDVDNTSDGALGVGGNSTLALLGDLKQNGDFHIFAGSRAVIFGDFSGAGGTSGTGTLEVLGRTSIGNSPASVQFGGDFAFGEEALFELGGLNQGEFDQLNVAGDLMLGGDLMVELWDGWSLGANQEYLIAQVGGQQFGQFSGLGEGDWVGSFGDYNLFISYTAGDGNDVSLFTAVPEAGSMTLLLFGSLGLLGQRRRRSS